MRRLNRAPALFALLAGVALMFAACSSMVEELKTTVSDAPATGNPALSVKGEPEFHDGVVTLVVKGKVRDNPKPKAVYKLPDGTKIEVEGTVIDNGDGTSTLTFDLNPAPDGIPEGPLNISIKAKGYDTTKIKVDYVPPKPLHVTDCEMKNPDGLVTMTVSDDVPLAPPPTVTYELPDGTKKEVEGTVVDNGDGTKTLTFDLKPLPPELLGGTLPITLNAPGYFKPADATVNYIPQAAPELDFGDKEGEDTTGDGKPDTYTFFNSEAEDFEEPKVKTNYHDNIIVETTYTVKPTGPVLANWEAVKNWLKDPANDGGEIEAVVTATPNPDTDPSSNGETRVTLKCKKDLKITSVTAGPDEPEEGETVVAKAFAGSEIYTGKTFTWQWYAADSSSGDGTPITGATNAKYTIAQGLYGKFLYAVATQNLPGESTPNVKESNRLEVKPVANLDIDVTMNTFTMTVMDLGQNQFKFTVATDLQNPTINWLVDGEKKSSGTSKEFTLDLQTGSYEAGWHNVDVLCVKDGTPYSARASVKKKIFQSAPDASTLAITNETVWKKADGKITGSALSQDRAQYSIDGGNTWIGIAGGEITGLTLGADWTAASALEVKLRYKGDDDHAASAITTVNVGLDKYSVAHAVTNGTISVSPNDSVPAGVTVTITATADSYYTLDQSSISATYDNAGTPTPLVLSGTGAVRTFTMPKADVTATANFTRCKFNVIVPESVDHGSVSADKTNVAWGDTVTLTVGVDGGYVIILKINGSASGVTKVDNQTYTFVMPTEDATVSAVCVINDGFVEVEGNGQISTFYACKHEVTQGEYAAYCLYSTGPVSEHGIGDDYPAYAIRWYDAIVYCNLRSIAQGLTPVYKIGTEIHPKVWPEIVESDSKYKGPTNECVEWNDIVVDPTANGYRLPTHDEWMYMATNKGADSYKYAGSDSYDEVAWFWANSEKSSHVVMTKNPVGLGIYDLSGNASEYLWDESEQGNAKRKYIASGYLSEHAYTTLGKTFSSSPWVADSTMGFRVVRNGN